MGFRSPALILALLLAGAVAATLHLRADRERVANFAFERAALIDSAAAASAERDALADRVARLESTLAAAASEPSAPRADVTAPALPPRDVAASAESEFETQAPATSAPQIGMPRGSMRSFDADRLVAAGFDRQDVDRFRARLDEIELRRLELRDQATREGWLDTPRFAEESQSLFGEIIGLRDEFEEPLYDWVLYSTGHPNRVAVSDVIAGSAGESAGLQPGDVILRYDDQLMLSVNELREATTQGRAGELVAVEVQREGENAPRRIFVPRGPIGIEIAPATLQPAPTG